MPFEPALNDLVPVLDVSANTPEGRERRITIAELHGLNQGTVNDALAGLSETYLGGVVTTKLTLSSFPVPVVSVSTGNGVGGALLYTFPTGFIKRLGCRAELSIAIATANQADFTDGTPEGDLGIGTLAPANADALGTDATDDDWGTATAFTMSSFAVSSVTIPTEADGVHDGSSTPVPLYLNALVDAADIDDDTTSQLDVSGTIWFSWLNQYGV